MNKCRTDSSSYHDPYDLLTTEQELEQDALREIQLDSFFNNFAPEKTKSHEILSDIIDSPKVELTIRAMVACSIKYGSVDAEDLVRQVRKEARKMAKNFIDSNNIFWDID